MPDSRQKQSQNPNLVHPSAQNLKTLLPSALWGAVSFCPGRTKAWEAATRTHAWWAWERLSGVPTSVAALGTLRFSWGLHVQNPSGRLMPRRRLLERHDLISITH